MCELEKYGTTRIDPCLVVDIKLINAWGFFRTLSSCCGHGKYPETIIVIDKKNQNVFEFNSYTFLGKGKRKGNRYYKKDIEGFYFIPEVMSQNEE